MKQADWDILAERGVTPDNLSVGGGLCLEGTNITALPDNLSVGGSLFLRNTNITSLPDNLSVGESLYLEGPNIPLIFTDERGYELRRILRKDGEWFVAGCRLFRSREEALAHWGSEKYPDKERGAQFVKAIIAIILT